MIDILQKLFITSRPISWVNTAYPFAAGYLLTIHQVDAVFVIGTLFYLIPYNLLMYGVNDVFDYDSDILNPRKGGIEGAKLPRKLHRLTLITAVSLTLPFLTYLLLRSSRPWGVLVLLADVFLVLAYSLPKLRFKERPFIDSMTSASHFVGPLVYALTFSHFTVSYVVIVWAFFLWAMASHAFGAVQDIIADRAAGIQSIATVLGAQRTVRFALFCYAASAFSLLHFGWSGLIMALVEMLYIISVWPFINLRDADAETANRAWKRFIKLNWLTGFVITMLLIQIYRG